MAWETRRLFGGLVSTSLDLLWGFLPVCGSGLARVWIGCFEILHLFLAIVFQLCAYIVGG